MKKEWSKNNSSQKFEMRSNFFKNLIEKKKGRRNLPEKVEPEAKETNSGKVKIS